MYIYRISILQTLALHLELQLQHVMVPCVQWFPSSLPSPSPSSHQRLAQTARWGQGPWSPLWCHGLKHWIVGLSHHLQGEHIPQLLCELIPPVVPAGQRPLKVSTSKVPQRLAVCYKQLYAMLYNISIQVYCSDLTIEK